jgi:hypothetical protein
MTPSGLIEISDLERWANEATAAEIDPVLVLAERGVEITAYGEGWITCGDVHLSLSAGCWYGTTWIGGRR